VWLQAWRKGRSRGTWGKCFCVRAMQDTAAAHSPSCGHSRHSPCRLQARLGPQCARAAVQTPLEPDSQARCRLRSGRLKAAWNMQVANVDTFEGNLTALLLRTRVVLNVHFYEARDLEMCAALPGGPPRCGVPGAAPGLLLATPARAPARRLKVRTGPQPRLHGVI